MDGLRKSSSVSHLKTIQLLYDSKLHFSSNNNLVAITKDKPPLITLWNSDDFKLELASLAGHKKAITALSFSPSGIRTFLCSGSSDCIILWPIEQVKAAILTHQDPQGIILSQMQGMVKHIAFNTAGTTIAACVNQTVFLFNTQGLHNTEYLKCTDDISLAEFLSTTLQMLLTVAEDRTFKIWNIDSQEMVYNSTIVSSSPLISVCTSPFDSTFLLGTYDGILRFYNQIEEYKCRLVRQLDILSAVKKLRTQVPSNVVNKAHHTQAGSKSQWRENVALLNDPKSDNSESTVAAILCIFYIPYGATSNEPNILFSQAQNYHLHSELYEQTIIAVGCTSGIFFINAKTLDILNWIDFSDIPMYQNVQSKNIMAGSIAISFGLRSSQLMTVIESLFTNEIHIFNIENLSNLLIHSGKFINSCNDVKQNHCSSEENVNDTLSVLSSVQLCDDSPLKEELSWKRKEQENKGFSNSSVLKPGDLNKKGKIVDNQPLTFHSKIKSSGYSAQAPRKPMFQPKMTSKNKNQNVLPSEAKSLVKEYPSDGDCPSELFSKVNVADRPVPINKLSFSANGKRLACALGNNSAQIFEMPYRDKSWAVVGHTGSINYISWSHTSQWLITSSDDCSAAIWSIGATKAALKFMTVDNNFDVDKDTPSVASSTNLIFTKPLRFSQFYYVDKFVLLASGNQFHLYKYQLDTSKSDVKRYQSNSRYKLVQSVSLQQAQQLTAMSAINSFYSYIVMCAGSDKSLEIFDMNVGRSVRYVESAHARTVHIIKQNEGSISSSYPSFAYDLFATSAISDCIKLWDLRTNRCIQRYEGQNVRTFPCGVAFSPCGRFITSGSEDKSAYVFDVRMGTYLHKLTGHSDTVCDTVFNPLFPELITGTLDGKIFTFH